MQLKLLLAFLLLFVTIEASAQTRVIDSLQQIIAQGKKDSVEAKAYIKLTDELSRKNIPAAKRAAYNAVALSKQLNHPLLLSAAYTQLTTLNAQINQPDSAKYYIALLKKIADQYPTVQIRTNYEQAAGLFYRSQGNYTAALPYLLNGLRLQQGDNTKNKVSLAGQNLNVGNNYRDMGDYRNAMTYHLKALALFEALGNKRGMSFAEGSVGGDFIVLKQYKTAMPHVEKSMALKNELDDKRGKAGAYMNLGDIAAGLQQFDKALANYAEALKINRSLKLTSEEAKTDLNIGRLYGTKNDVSNALLYFTRSRDLFRQIADTAYATNVNAEIINLQKNEAKQKTAEKTLFTSLNSSITTGNKDAEIGNYKYLAELYAKNKQFDKALKYNEKYHNESEKLQGKELEVQLKELEERYNLEKKEKEIVLLKKDRLLDKATLQNQKIFRYGAVILLVMLLIIGFLILARSRAVQSAKRLVEIERIRNTIARNLHDDIGSTLSSINILSKVALKQAGENADISRDLEKIKTSSSGIMESMSDIVWAINPANDPLEKTILKMREFAAVILEPAGIEFTFNEEGKLADLKLGVDERKNLYLIFKEAVNNIAKYSGASEVEVVLQKNSYWFVMTITDNGSGFDSAKQHNGNGIKNMRGRSGEMNAVFGITSEAGKGTSTFVRLPIT